MRSELSVWGWVPLALPLLILCAQRLAWLVFPNGKSPERAAATAVFAMAIVHLEVLFLARLEILSGPLLVGLLAGATAVLVFITRGHRRDDFLKKAFSDGWPAMTMIGVIVLLATMAARLLPIWQWDAYGYHLPFVNFVVQSGSFRDVPNDLRYISTYPHNIELGMIWLRAMLPDDRLVDLAQLPYGVAGAVIVSAMARQMGAFRGSALLAGAAWLGLPSVLLQLPTDYVDVGTGAALLGAVFFLFGPLPDPLPAGRGKVVGGVALGLFLGSKPSAPVAVAFILFVTLIDAVRTKQLKPWALGLLATIALGAEMYVLMLLRHGNPVWPVQVHLGPFMLPGESSMEELLAAGADLDRAHGNLLERLTTSWLAVGTTPVFDMRVGGLGLAFLFALPFAIAALVRRKRVLLVCALAATLLSADPSIGRYVLAFPGLVFALAVVELSKRERLVALVLALTLGWHLVRARPGLSKNGPPLEAFVSMTDEERRFQLGPDGPPFAYPELWSLIGPGESVLFDVDFEFPGLLWTPDLRYPVYGFAVGSNASVTKRLIDTRHVRALAIGSKNQALLGELPGRWERLFSCTTATCGVWVRRD